MHTAGHSNMRLDVLTRAGFGGNGPQHAGILQMAVAESAERILLTTDNRIPSPQFDRSGRLPVLD